MSRAADPGCRLAVHPSRISRRNGRSNSEPTLDCIRRVYGTPATRDASVRFWKEPVIPECPASRPALDDTLAALGFRVFDAQDFVVRKFAAFVVDLTGKLPYSW